MLLTLSVSAAQGFMALGQENRALDHLEQFAKLAASDIYPLQLHGDSYFGLLDAWLEKNLTLGTFLRKPLPKTCLKML